MKKQAKPHVDGTEFERSSGNVFADLRLAQPNVSALLNYRLDNFSSEKLLEFFYTLGYDVDFLIRPTTSSQRGSTRVLMAV